MISTPAPSHPPGRDLAAGVVAHDADAELERRIAEQADKLGDAPTDAEKISAWRELQRLHVMRSPERIEKMERKAGIR